MKYQTMIAYGSIIAGVAVCSNPPREEKFKAQKEQRYFASVEMNSNSGMALTTGDFDGDGDLDLIVGAYKTDYNDPAQGALYLFLNDGKGNFTLKEPTKK